MDFSSPLDIFQEFLILVIAGGITFIVYLLNELRQEEKNQQSIRSTAGQSPD